jgi:hypothetical protein
MRIRIGGPLPVRFELNRLMFAGMAIGAVGIAVWGAGSLGLLPGGIGRREEGGGPLLAWGEAGMGLTLAGIALYFLGRIVQLWVHLRRGD